MGGSFPVFWQKASGCRVQDVDGNVYLDFTAAFGVAGVGHSHPDVIRAIQAQSALLVHGMGDVHPSEVKARLLQRIAARVPVPDARIILGQNGSDAVEAALKTARLVTGRRGILAFQGGYHGLSYGALDATARADFRAPFQDQLGHFSSHLPFGCPIETIAEALAENAIGAVLVEPIQGRGGIRIPPDGWLSGLASASRAAGALLIADEIFTGWGRTGTWFACDFENVVPDILCIGKAMGGGLPISACVASESLMAHWGVSRGEALHTSTFLGNPLACAAALAAIAIMEREALPGRAARSGALLLQGLRSLAGEFPERFAEARGRGLMIGLQCRSAAVSLHLVDRALAMGLILLPAGDGSVIEFVPPLIVAADEIEAALGVLRRACRELP
jgi:acetylornithine/succinyldiaminopimelate/putrescine aminotransferase